jgi:tRNA wybutosine-synthesizing protein 2
MFSRGNISEKARVLGNDAAGARTFPGLTESELQDDLGNIDVVDMYVGIGYFAFSYLGRGVRTVWGWDINPWSIEGLRRGCEHNGWRCLVLRVSDEGSLVGITAEEVAQKLANPDVAMNGQTVKCIALLGDNRWTNQVMGEIQVHLNMAESASALNVRHVNLGLLPTSEPSWQNATRLLLKANQGGTGGWLHIHENVEVRQIELMTKDIVRRVTEIVCQDENVGIDAEWLVSCSHVEQVKTYAPGVMHCVFDICIMPNSQRFPP